MLALQPRHRQPRIRQSWRRQLPPHPAGSRSIALSSKSLFAHRLVAVHRSPFRPHRQPGLEIVGHQDLQQWPMRLAVLVRSGRIALAQLGSMRRAHRRAIQKECAAARRHPGGSIWAIDSLENAVAAFLHDRKRQRLPCLIIGASMAGRRLALFVPVSDSLTRPRPKVSGQTLQHLEYSGFQRRTAMEPLGTSSHRLPEASTRYCCVLIGLRFGLAQETGLVAVAGTAKQA